jgi:alkylation response protein AidB-like acyl-CoA dehydrogenase
MNIIHPLINKKHNEWREKVHEFAETEIKPIARELDEHGRFSSSLTRKMGKLGLLGMFLPQVYGGQNTDTLSYIIAVEELARVDSSQAATLAAHNSLGIGPIFNFGSEKQKRFFLPKLVTGEKLWAFGLTEPMAGSDATSVKTTAQNENSEWIVNGEKIFITNAASELAAGITLEVVTGSSNGKPELSTMLVDRASPGYTTEVISNKMMWRAADTGKVKLVNCRVPLENLLGARGEGAHIMLSTLDSGRLSIAAMGLGLAQGAFEMALTYSKERVQFGKPISKHQAISFKLAEMAKKIELARNTLYNACWLKDNKHSFSKESAIAKLYCSEIARDVADEALQIHGAYGLVKNNDVERFYRDQRILQIGEGTSEILKLVISRHIGV